MEIGRTITLCGALTLIGLAGLAGWAVLSQQHSQTSYVVSGDIVSAFVVAATVAVYLIFAGLVVDRTKGLSTRLIQDLLSLIFMIGGWTVVAAALIVGETWAFFLILAVTLLGLVGRMLVR
jgi:hypothetical protein